MPHGPWLKTGEWEDMLKDRSEHFAVVGELLEYVISPTGIVTRPKMMNTLMHAMLWFHEGCRDTIALMAIVKFAASMDALACGERSGGIKRLINSQLGIQDSTIIRSGGPTLKQAIEEIYSEGRSRTMHGNNEKLSHDWAKTRGLAEEFARLCLMACIAWAANNPSCNDPKQLKS
jgi:hypothetical protein